MSAARASLVSGPVAMMHGRSLGTAVTSPATISTSGSSASRRVISALKRSRSTASAPPAGTRVSSAARITKEPSRRISSLSRPTALDRAAPRKELLHTSSHRLSLDCAGVLLFGLLLEQPHADAARGELKRCFRARQPRSDDGDDGLAGAHGVATAVESPAGGRVSEPDLASAFSSLGEGSSTPRE